MDFQEAVEMLKSGRVIRRLGWPCGRFLFKVDSIALLNGKEEKIAESAHMQKEDGTIYRGWFGGNDDLLEKDWESPNTDFNLTPPSEAQVKQMLCGRSKA